MRHFGQISVVGGSLVALIVLAGFFGADSARPSARECTPVASVPGNPPAPQKAMRVAEDARAEGGFPAFMNGKAIVAGPTQAPQGLLNLTNAPGYRRAGDLSLRVQDCTKAEDVLETKLQDIHGEILEMLMEGTEGSRICTLSVVIPADKFRGFIADLRGMGKIQTERITASKLKPGQSESASVEAGPDPRELSLVSIRMADEKVAQTVLESRGVLASSFDRGASHFMKGLAVLVEVFGLVLPFALAFAGVAAPFLVALRFRRPKSAAAIQ